MADQTEKSKIFEFHGVMEKIPLKFRVVWVVAKNESEARGKMASHGYTVGNNILNGDYWLERTHDKVFDELIII